MGERVVPGLPGARCCEFGWHPGDFVLCENLATWHYAVNDYDFHRVYRKVIAG